MAHSTSAEQWKAALGLRPHPEGGYYRQYYKSAQHLPADQLPSCFGQSRSCCTAIYYLLDGTEFSALHRLRQDEIWHFYAGSALTVHEIDPEGQYRATRVGIDLRRNQVPQHIVPGGHYFGATVDRANSYALVGCTVAPGFEYHDFELADRADLLQRYPQHQRIIKRLTRTQ